MDAVLKVIEIVGAAWLLLSILLAVAWALGGKRIFRKPTTPPTIVINNERFDDTVDAVVAELNRRERMNGGL
jgi:hypothetical protein